ncbi:type II toxin-antitoxin system HicA family toxin [Hymenobacter fastidiosus]
MGATTSMAGGAAERLTVPVHSNQDLKRGLLAHLLKQAGLTEVDG